MTLDNITLEFQYLNDAKPIKITAQLQPDGTWHQWGASNERLSENVDLLEAIAKAVAGCL